MSLLDYFRGNTPPVADPLRLTRSTSANMADQHKALPETEDGWKTRYQWLHDWYAGNQYDSADVTALRLFKSVDTDGDVIAMAQRLSRDFQFIVDTDTHALAGGRWSLQLAGQRSGDLAAGELVWRRSGLQAHKAAWIRSTAIAGDMWLEPVRFADGVRLVAYDARHCVPTYSPDGTTLERLEVVIRYFGDADSNGTRAIHVYRRTLTPDSIQATEQDRDGVPQEITGESGEHRLGVVPAVHLRMTEIVGCPEHSLTAGHGLQLPLAAMDSFVAQIRAVAERWAHPMLVGKGLQFPANFAQLGRHLDNIPPEADVSYLEPALAGIVPLWQVIREMAQDTRSTIPEFTLAGSGANTSGRALEFRADQFRRKMLDAQTRIHAEIAKATHYAVLLEQRAAYDLGDEPYRIAAPPPLPIDRQSHMTQVSQAYSGGFMKRADAVRQAQAVGLIDEEVNADAYAADLDAEAASRAPVIVSNDEPTD